MVAAGLRSGSRFEVSLATGLSDEMTALLREHAASVLVETDDAWSTRLCALPAGRVRYIGAPERVARLTDGRVDLAVWSGPVLEAGRVELLPFLLEQAVSITAHRFGSANPTIDAVVAELRA